MNEELKRQTQLYADVMFAGIYLKDAPREELFRRIKDFEEKLKKYEEGVPSEVREGSKEEIENYKNLCDKKKKELEGLVEQ